MGRKRGRIAGLSLQGVREGQESARESQLWVVVVANKIEASAVELRSGSVELGLGLAELGSVELRSVELGSMELGSIEWRSVADYSRPGEVLGVM